MTIKQLLLELQAKKIKIKQRGENPHFKSKYILLDDILEAYIPILNEHNVLLYHHCECNMLITHLKTDEEDWTSSFPIPSDNPQKT